MNKSYDIAIAGSGFAGSLLAMIARRLGRSVVLLEKGAHPRVVIGESSTPLSNLLLEDIASRYDLPALAPLSKWGSWQRVYPEIACGLKRGFTFHHHVLGCPLPPSPDREDQLLVAASPHDAIADTHWYRADFDHFLVKEAEKLGAEYLDRVMLDRFIDNGQSVTLEGHRNGTPIGIEAKFVVDATGPRGFLHRALQLSELELRGLPRTQALFNHFTGVKRLRNSSASRTSETPPYPIDNAAVHHVFDGGWVWVLQFNNGVTSAGVAATDEVADQLKFTDSASAWGRLLQQIPALQEQFEDAQPQRPFTHMPCLSFRSSAIAGARWALLPSAAGFVDPLLSTGFPLTLLGVSRIAEIIERNWDAPQFSSSLAIYAEKTDTELVAASRLIGALYANMGNFSIFVELTLLYFAAVSYSEAARRLSKAHLAPSFLMSDDSRFGPGCADICERALHLDGEEEATKLIRDIQELIEPINVAGLGNPARRNWYPVDAEDMIRSAHKLGASREDIVQLLQRCGFEANAESEPLSVSQD